MESGIHGTKWHDLHGGYFADKAVAKRFLDIVQNEVTSSVPDTIVDIGGGTGFILRELIERSVDPAIRLVNLDLSRKQLSLACENRIVRVRLPMSEFRREDIRSKPGRVLFIMRSVLHYCGKEDLAPFLRHLRSQMKKGELFIHQTACFDLLREARCLNRLYELMGTGKWYPTTKYLHRLLEQKGWAVKSITPAPALLLTSSDLGRRYRLRKRHIQEIGRELSGRFGDRKNLFELTPDGFRAYLHYRIFVCTAR